MTKNNHTPVIISRLKYLFMLVFLCGSATSFSQGRIPPKQRTRILFLFDASQSMYAKWETNTKFEIARKLLDDMVDSLQAMDNLELALRVYGHQKHYPPQDCDDTKLEVPFGKKNGRAIKKRLSEISPNGTTPIARSLEESGGDFPKDAARNIIILITDGIEECNGDPCAASALLQKRGVVLKPFVIGLGINKDFLKQFECVGNYFDATNEAQFQQALNIVITQALNNTSIQVNLIDAYGKASETNVPMTFYDRFSGEVRYDIMHTMNVKGVPDTLQIDPLGTYNITVHTIPPVSKDSIYIIPGKHNVVGIDAPQGDLQLKIEGSNDYKNLEANIRKHDDMTTLNVQDFNSSQRYIIGDYDLEILTNPRIYLNNVNISQSKTTTVQIPNPGIVTLTCNSPGYGSILLEDKNKLKWVYTLSTSTVKESIILQPGNYRIVFRPKNSQSSQYTIEKSFRIASGSSISLPIN